MIRSVTCKCITYRKYIARPKAQMLGQLPVERSTPGSVFDEVVVDYAGSVFLKYGYVRKPNCGGILHLCVCLSLSLSLSVKAVHLELVTDLT